MNSQALLATQRPEAHNFKWKCLNFGKIWFTGELESHQCSGETISPVFHRCTSVKYRTLPASLCEFDLSLKKITSQRFPHFNIGMN